MVIYKERERGREQEKERERERENTRHRDKIHPQRQTLSGLLPPTGPLLLLFPLNTKSSFSYESINR
jgi:hypothetical protein